MAADLLAPRPALDRRRLWLIGTFGATLISLLSAPLIAPKASAAPLAALSWQLFVGSSVHVGATAWFYAVPEVRRHMASHRGRYLWSPLALVAGGIAAALTLPASTMALLLIAFFGWQFFHFQKQNFGLTALAARTSGASAPTVFERRVLVIAGVGGVLTLIGHASVLQIADMPLPRVEWLFLVGATVVCCCVVTGIGLVARRAKQDRPAAFVAAYGLALVFFVPPLVFDSPYAAVAGLTIAHGLQYLLLVGLVAATPDAGRSAALGLAVLLCIAVVVGLVLNRLSHLHGSAGLGAVLFGVYLGLTSAHFVIDAGLWRLRDEFPRSFLARRIPYLLLPS